MRRTGQAGTRRAEPGPRPRWTLAAGAGCAAALLAVAGCTPSADPQTPAAPAVAAASPTGVSPESHGSITAIRNTLRCVPFDESRSIGPSSLGQSADRLTGHGAQEWETCHAGGDSFLIVRFDSAAHAATAATQLVDNHNTWSYGFPDSPFVLFLFHWQARDYAMEQFGDRSSGRGPSPSPQSLSSASASSSAAATLGLAATGSVPYRTPEGYTFTLAVRWAADAGVPEVGSNPPGKTDLAFAGASFAGTVTGTTVGGRALPRLPGSGDFDAVALVALYPAGSAACRLPAGGGGFDLATHSGLGMTPGGTNGRTCYLLIQPVLGAPAARRALDRTFPADTPVPYTWNDLAVSGSSGNGLRVSGVPEDTAPALAAVLNSPLGYGLADFESTGPESIAPVGGTLCSYPPVPFGGAGVRVAVLQTRAQGALDAC
ncbi:hypothetical protein ACIQBJ_14635 [Kitasatospora sp. NPDC088391]|uniref:hypothetical protein n=1 Tax=Kitasatospora sp. NPDC088391 TaxID=3364074 RepID=UPI0038238EA3